MLFGMLVGTLYGMCMLYGMLYGMLMLYGILYGMCIADGLHGLYRRYAL